jgi:FixJ family two-component response regulator
MGATLLPPLGPGNCTKGQWTAGLALPTLDVTDDDRWSPDKGRTMNPTMGVQGLRMTPGAESALPTVHVVDDEPDVRLALARLLASTRNYQVQTHGCADDFLAAHDPALHACVVLDVGLPGLDGVGLQSLLRERDQQVSIVFLSGCTDVPTCADALRHGAVDFLTKPVDEALLFAAVERALARDASSRKLRLQQSATAARLASLTPREREVLAHVVEGRLNKQIAADIGTAEKTVKVHRARGMEKMQVRSVAELVRLVERGRIEIAS